MIAADILVVFEKGLAGLPGPVTIEYFQSGESALAVPGREPVPCRDCKPTLELLQQITAVSDGVDLRVHEITHDPQLAAEFDIDRVPGMVFRGGRNRRLRLYGLPLGHFLPVLLDAIRTVSREPDETPAEFTRILDQIDQPLQVRVLGSSRHPSVHPAATSAYTLASQSERVEASVYVMETFPDLVRELEMTSTPLTFVNDSRGFAGVTGPVDLAQYALDCQNEPENPRPPQIATDSIAEVEVNPRRAGAGQSSSGLVLPASAPGVWRPRGSGPAAAPTAAAPTAAAPVPAAAPPVPGPAAPAPAPTVDSDPRPEVARADVAIIGGGPAGLQAALVLSRARRAVVVFDEPSPPRNAASHGVHGFLGLEGMPPEEVRRVAWEQIDRYESASLREKRVLDVQRAADGDFLVTTEQGAELSARHVILAFGYRDVLPDIPGFAECWGETIIPCVLCDGYEHRDRTWGIVRASADSATTDPFMALHWTDAIHFIQGGDAQLPPGYDSRLRELGVRLHQGDVASISHDDTQIRGVTLDTGAEVEIETLLWMPPSEPSPLLPRLVESLGVMRNPAGNLAADPSLQTGVEGVWAVGDVRAWAGAMSAAHQGETAAKLLLRDWYQ